LPQRSSNGDRTKVIKTLINSFRYPRKGPGMMWEACAEKVKAMGGKLEMAARVNGCAYDESKSTWTVQFKDRGGNLQSVDHADFEGTKQILRQLDLHPRSAG
jgi:protoporphyrinogen oxidase